MQARFIGPPDLIGKLNALLALRGVESRMYPARSGGDLRLYVNLDDREAERLLESTSAPVHKRTRAPRKAAARGE